MRPWIIALLYSNVIFAVECNMTFVKTPCWQNYTVMLKLIDESNDKEVTSATLAPNNLWQRTTFECQPGQHFRVRAKYTPAIWEGDADKVFMGKSIIALPAVAPPAKSIWAIHACFANDFKNVSNPLSENTDCDCSQIKIPPVKNPAS